ncbi:receptor-like protein EIX1 [Quercus robur]|uniref:receptor-like protein EIX1 n=1 Tax=Quercus robur TaxID=38942 RepID=UPI00216142E4|nr:receptor-like protein EIX1 [Quercus robur]
MKMITLTGGRSFKLLLLHAFLLIMLSAHLSPALGFISGVGVGDANNIRCIEGERQALLEFKKGLVDDYGRLSSWQSGDENKNCCNWEGVRCSNLTGHVLELHLSALQNDDEGEITKPFGGMISSSLLELPYLTFLDLSLNNFNQSYIPKFIGSLSNLKHLNLADANLSGPIPHHLQNLSHLQLLDLSWNDWKNIETLEWLSHLSSIEDLDLSYTNLSVANDWFEVVSSLPNLKTLLMQSCDLPPMSLSSFSHFNDSKSFASLKILDLSENQLVHVPKSLGNICTLRELNLWSNHLNGQLVELITNLSGCVKDSLEILALSDNQITGSLPNFAIFLSLKEIDLSMNKLNGTLPKSIGNLYMLEVLSVDSNLLQGVISESLFSNLSKLQSLDLSNNSLSLEFSFDWVPPFQLNRIHLTSCNLGPRFPNWILTQRNVSFLEISNNKISDTISAEWLADLPPTLKILDLSNNHIYGQLPNVSTKGLNDLSKIDWSANSLEGPLPHFPTNLTILNLSKNQFSGSISSLCKINGQFLAYLDLSNNRLSGRLPNCFMQWPKLVVLNLAGNHFFGEVPSSLGSLSVLNSLSLNNNNFSGNLPSSLRNCSSLIVMDMRNNRFSGNVPAWIGECLPSLIILSLRSNMFNGSIPLHLCWLQDLQILDLSLNDISGTIPQCLNNFTSMAQKINYFIEEVIPPLYDGGIMPIVWDSVMVELKRNEFEYHGLNLGLLKIINLSSNKLIGKLPIEICNLLDLISLNVSRNNLIGEIPQMIGQLKQLESLDLSSNQFSGEIPSSISEINFLEFLNLSYNNLSGKIPLGTQLQGFDASYFIGNRALCGTPLTQKCPGEETPSRSEATTKDIEENEDELGKWFFMGTGCGFAIGFWGVCSSLLLKRSWRHAYFLLLDNMKDWIDVTITVNIARLQRKIQRQG